MKKQIKRTVYRTIKSIAEQSLAEKIIMIVSIVFLVWVLGSYIEVITHNMNQVPDYTYNPFNAFSIFLKLNGREI